MSLHTYKLAIWVDIIHHCIQNYTMKIDSSLAMGTDDTLPHNACIHTSRWLFILQMCTVASYFYSCRKGEILSVMLSVTLLSAGSVTLEHKMLQNAGVNAL